MESIDEVNVGLFRIGPSTLLGRRVVLAVLLCKSLKEVLVTCRRVCSRFVSSVKEFAYMNWRKYAANVLLLLKPSSSRALLAMVVCAALLIRRSQVVTLKAQSAYRRKFWSNLAKSACTYDEWAHAAKMLEKDSTRRKDSDLYDENLVRAKLKQLQMRRTEGGVRDIIFCLRTDLVRNLGHMCNPELHKGRVHVPGPIQEYIDEVRYHLRAVCDLDSDDLPLEEKLSFIQETRHAFGRTALLLSGGASFGGFHGGVVRTLIQHRVLPRVVAGASVGSIICSAIATRTWPELQSFFGENLPALTIFDQLDDIFTIASRLFTKGAVHEIRLFQQVLRELTRNLTFQEAYEMTGRVLGISVTSARPHEPPRCLNYLTSPHVLIWSAVTASCAFPGLFEAQELMAKDKKGRLIPYHPPVQGHAEEPGIGTRHWRDGTLESDLPKNQLKELFSVNHFIVSQVNPHAAPLLRIKDFVQTYGGDLAAKLVHLMEMEVKHRCNQILEVGLLMTGVAKIFVQDWEGDVTIVMPATLLQFVKLIQNPTPVDLQKAVNQGRRCTWEKLSAIKANCGIELMLDECVSVLNHQCRLKRLEKNSLKKAKMAVRSFGGSKRSPSWNCLEPNSPWSTLDDDGKMETALKVRGPWDDYSLGKAMPSHGMCDGSDSESDNMETSHHHWIKARGQFMRTGLTVQFVQQCCRAETQTQEISNGVDIGESSTHVHGRQSLEKDLCASKQVYKIQDRNVEATCDTISHYRKSGNIDTE